MANLSIPDCGKGVNKDVLSSELLPGFWSDCSNFRFRNGFAEQFEGLSTVATPSLPLFYIASYASTTTRFLIEGAISKFWAFDGVTRTEITRYTDGVDIASITRVGTTATLTTASAHGRTTGDSVTVYLALPSQYNGTYVITVTGATTFTYTMASDPGASASQLGAYSYNVTSNFTGTANDRITGGSLNGVLMINNPVNGLYYWGGSTATRLRKFPFGNVADAGRPFKNYFVQLASTISGVKKPHNVAWSNATDPGSIPTTFTASASNDAGNVDLAETPGAMVDCLPLGDTNIIYKKDARYAMQYVGSNEVFRFVRLPGTDGLYSVDCVVDTPKGHVFLTQNKDVMIHQGGSAVSIAEGRVRNWLRTNISDAAGAIAFLCVNPEKAEVWVSISNGAVASSAGTVAVWNWDADTWGIFDFSSDPIKAFATGLWPTALTPNQRLLVYSSTANVSLVDSTNTATVVGVLERAGLHMEDRNAIKMLQRSRWGIDYIIPPSLSVTHGASFFPDEAPVYAPATTYAPASQDWACVRARNARYCAIKMTNTGRSIKVRNVDLDVTKVGVR